MQPHSARILRLLVLLVISVLLGALANFPIAWCVLSRFDTYRKLPFQERELSTANPQWPCTVPSDWPPPEQIVAERQSGWEFIEGQGSAATAEESSFCHLTQMRLGFPFSAVRSSSGYKQTTRRFVPDLNPRYVTLEQDTWVTPAWLSRLNVRSRLPVGIIWPGFFLNTAVYACILLVIAHAFGTLRRILRRRSNRCEGCGYDRSGLPIGARCPECGRPPKSSEKPLSASPPNI